MVRRYAARAARVVAAVVASAVTVTAVVSTVYGLYVALSGAGFDHTSPVPDRQRTIAVAGEIAVVAVTFTVVIAVAWTLVADLPHDGGDIGPVLVLVAVLALAWFATAAPLHMRVATIDVTDAGFRQAEYRAPPAGPSHLHVYNARTVPIEVCVTVDGVCTGRPRTTVEARTRTTLGWPENRYGEFTLSVVGPLPAGARASTTLRLTRPDPPENHGPPPAPPQPYWPPMPQPPLR